MYTTAGAVVVPTFTLFRVDPAQVVEEYNRGVYTNIVVPRIGNISLNYSSLIRPVYGHTPDDSTFCFHNRSGLENVFFTTDHLLYKAVCEQNQPIKDKECDWCRILTTHDMVTMPVRITSNSGLPVFQGQRPYCDFECMYAHFKDRERGIDFRHAPKSGIEHLIKAMFALAHPGQELFPAPYYGLLIKNGGHLTEGEFKKRSHRYVSTGTFIMAPLKEVYQKVSM